MKKLILIFLTIHCSLFTIHCISQPCLPEGITFTTQEQIDNFQVNYPGCIEIEGDVEIGDSYPGTDITNLNGLSVLTSIGSDLNIYHNKSLASLEGLVNLTHIEGSLDILGNDSLINLTGLNNLAFIPGSLSIRGNDGLINLTGLNNLISISGGLSINWNDALASLYGLENLTSIGGMLDIGGNDSLTSLVGLEGLTSIVGDLKITSNDSLTSLVGLTGLTSIGGSLNMEWNDALTSLTGLEGLTSIGENLRIDGNHILINLTGLESLTSIGGDLEITKNTSMTSLSGLDNLNTIGGSLIIGLEGYPDGDDYGNPLLVNLEGLENLTSIGGDLMISSNDLLNSLAGIENLDGDSLDNILIYGNPSLYNCDILSLCDFLASPNGSIDIYYNAPGCNNLAEVASNCGITLPCLPYGNYYFINQSDIDNFETNYPGCTDLEGDVNIGVIYNSDISNLNGLGTITTIGGNLNIKNTEFLTNLVGLEGLTSIEGNLRVYGNEALNNLEGLEGLTTIVGGLKIDGNYEWPLLNNSLTSLDGLENLSSIGGYLELVSNPVLADLTSLEGLSSIGGDLLINSNVALTSLDGLGSLTTVGGDLKIGWWMYMGGGNNLTSLAGLENLTSIGGSLGISENNALTSLEGLDGVTTIGGSIGIHYNSALSSLTGLENIDPGSIDSIYISWNSYLSICHVESICAYITSPNAVVGIHYNAPGCSSPIEVLQNCGCFPEGITFTTQAQTDSFGVNFPYCTEIGGINGEVIISGDDITNLNGLSTLTFFGNDLKLLSNGMLTSLAGLENVNSIGGTLHIEGNESMSNLWGLTNIEPGSISDLNIINNSSLSGCNIQNICEYLTSPGGTIQIVDNAPGCNSQQEVEASCSSCLPEGITFTTQTQIDSFMINYGSCSWIEGDLTINGEDISDLSGLELITYIDGSVTIGTLAGNANPQLTSLSGLNNLAAIGGNLKIYSNEALINLEGLEYMGFVFGSLYIGNASLNAGNPALSSLSGLEGLNYLGGLRISGNEALTSLTALNGLNFIEGQLRIKDNSTLTSLDGLQNVNSGSINYLQIISNDLLYECEVQTVCDYLAAPNGNINIYDNAPGCNSPEEVQEACNSITSLPELTTDNSFTISPNPMESTTIIKYNLNRNSPVSLKIFDINGREIKTLVNEVQSQGEQSVIFNTVGLIPGIYICTLNTIVGILSKKIIKLN